MRAPRLAFLLLTGILLWTAPPLSPPACAAQGVASIQHDLKRIEDRLLAGEWARAKAACDGELRNLIQRFAREEGARPRYGVILAFRAVAEAGLGDMADAVWDWTAAAQLAPDATGFDLGRFGTAGRALGEAVATEPEAFDAGGPPKPRGRLPSPELPGTAIQTGYLFDCRVQTTVTIDEEGQLSRVRKVEGNCLESDTTLAVLAVENLRRWRFEPAERDGKRVSIHYQFTTNFRRTY